MQYSCKYPKKLTRKSYCQKILKEHMDPAMSGFSDDERLSLVSFPLQSIRYLIERSGDHLGRVLDYLLQVEALSQTECASMIDVTVEEETQREFRGLLLVFRNPILVIDLVENNYKVTLDRTLDEHYVRFLQKVTRSCIGELVEVNRSYLQRLPKKVCFSDAGEPEAAQPPEVMLSTPSQEKRTLSDLDGNLGEKDTCVRRSLKS
jgi:hypothetical protein